MKNPRTTLLAALLVLSAAGAQAQTNTLSSLSIGTASTAGGTANGVALVTPRIGTPLNDQGSVSNTLSGIQYVAGQIPLDGAPASVAFFALGGEAIPAGGGPASAFTSYGTLVSPTQVNTYADPASKLIPDSYSALTFAAADLGFGASNFYMIHHAANNVDYLAEIVPGTGTATLVADLKPMSWQGPTAATPASPGNAGYFALSWATGILSAGAPYADQSLYYLRTDASSHTQFGVMIPALTGASSDTLDLTAAVGSFGVGGYTTLTFSPSVIGNYGANQFYYLRLDPITGNTIFGWLNPSLVAGTRTISDIANLGGVFNALTFAPDATGPAGAWGSSQFYITGSLPAGAQSISFAAIPDHNNGDVFTVTPTASSNLDIDVTVVSGPATVQTTGVSGATPSSLRVFTVTTTGVGIVTLQARQAGSSAPAFTANLLQQSFNVLGTPPTAAPAITSQTTSDIAGTVGTPGTIYTITGTNSPTGYSTTALPPGLTVNPLTGAISGTPTGSGTYTVTVTATNGLGSGSALVVFAIASSSTPTPTPTPTPGTPVISSSTPAPGTVGTPISTYPISASGSPTSYTATGLPPGLTVNPSTGAITGTPTASGTYVVTLTATNSSGTGTSTLTFDIASVAGAPVISSPTPAPGTVGTPITTYPIVASGSPSSYTATGLPPGLTVNPSTGAITGTPTASGTYTVTVTATNSSGTTTSTVTMVIAGASPIGHIMNFSARALSGPGSDTLIVGFVVNGDGKNLLVRGIGPGLAEFGIANFIANPTLTLYNSADAIIAWDTGWSVNSAGVNDSALIASTSASAGAFPLAAGSADSALLITLNNGAHTAGLLTTETTQGVGLVEIYDVGGNANANLTNVSARMNVSGGDGILVAGFVIGGTTPMTVLIRGVGPGLTEFGVTGVLADPQIAVFSGSTQIAINHGWGTGASTAAQLSTAFSEVGAFPLTAGSADSALLITLQPGPYTVEVSSVSGATGVALIEVYDTQ